MKISTSKLTSSKKDAATQLSALEDELEMILTAFR